MRVCKRSDIKRPINIGHCSFRHIFIHMENAMDFLNITMEIPRFFPLERSFSVFTSHDFEWLVRVVNTIKNHQNHQRKVLRKPQVVLLTEIIVRSLRILIISIVLWILLILINLLGMNRLLLNIEKLLVIGIMVLLKEFLKAILRNSGQIQRKL